jgi:REP element-mobilizing transposase RayT
VPENRQGHHARPALASRFPVHVTLKVRAGVDNLRRGHAFAVLRRCFARGNDRFGFRLAHFTVQSNHLHLVCEAADAQALARGMQGLAVRIARNLNRRLGRKGTLFARRYHARILRTPTEVRRTLVYVYQNHAHHRGTPAPTTADERFAAAVDPRTSAAWASVWRTPIRDMRLLHDAERGPPPVMPPRTWLLATGWWRRLGRLEPGGD